MMIYSLLQNLFKKIAYMIFLERREEKKKKKFRRRSKTDRLTHDNSYGVAFAPPSGSTKPQSGYALCVVLFHHIFVVSWNYFVIPFIETTKTSVIFNVRRNCANSVKKD